MTRPPSRPIVFAVTHTEAGGIRELWCDLAEGLRARGHDVRLMAFYPHSHEGPGALAEGWEFIVPRRPRGVLGGVRLVAGLVGWLRRVAPAAIIAANPATNAALPWAALAARRGTRVVLTQHVPASTHNALLDRATGIAAMLPHVRAVVCVSDAVARTNAGKPAKFRAKCQTIHNALPPRIEALLDGLHRVRSVPGGRVVALGRLDRQKNYPLLIEALAQAPGLRLDAVGEGADRAAIAAQIARLGLAERVTLHGRLPRVAALEIAAGGDIFAQVSLFEGHSLALIEAARLGLPLVVSDVPEQVEGVTTADGTVCAAVVPLGDPARLAAVLRAMAGDAEVYARWAGLALKLGRESTFAAMLDRYAALIDGG